MWLAQLVAVADDLLGTGNTASTTITGFSRPLPRLKLIHGCVYINAWPSRNPLDLGKTIADSNKVTPKWWWKVRESTPKIRITSAFGSSFGPDTWLEKATTPKTLAFCAYVSMTIFGFPHFSVHSRAFLVKFKKYIVHMRTYIYINPMVWHFRHKKSTWKIWNLIPKQRCNMNSLFLIAESDLCQEKSHKNSNRPRERTYPRPSTICFYQGNPSIWMFPKIGIPLNHPMFN